MSVVAAIPLANSAFQASRFLLAVPHCSLDIIDNLHKWNRHLAGAAHNN